ncbi:unnamed protein product [Caenorhabditis auriculariae]|uniref:non-specific serine/threonine protein kinase n=1 Tax=Caenorhabditis auriculariae TaxID=2777116 RepID=A0A8S1GSJ7_9PELO|nr:unnamed protein product [Caenorhabditis auriculariae]
MDQLNKYDQYRPYQRNEELKLTRITRGKAADPFMERGTIIGVGRTFRVEKIVGGGAFGQIYRATDLEAGLVVAVKVEPKSRESARLVLELSVLVQLIGGKHIPRVLYSGELGKYNFIVMQMLGRNLADLRRIQRNKHFSQHTSVRIGVQCIEGLRDVHKLGFIHRDIKPSNVCVGIGEHRRILYVVDFGMARQVRRPNGTFRRERSYASFRGTTRYVSLAVHDRKDQGMVDDLWCLYYSMVEMSEGGVPWRNLTDQDEISRAKRVFNKTYSSRRMGKPFDAFPLILEKLTRTDVPDYDRLINVLKSCVTVFDDTIDFEWDDESSTQSMEFME